MLRIVVVYRSGSFGKVAVMKDSFVVGKTTTFDDILEEVGMKNIPAADIISVSIVND